MKKLLFILFAFSFSLLNAQIVENPVTWSWETEKISETEYKLIYNATIEEGWHLYSAHVDPDVGPYPTAFYYDTIPNFIFKGKVEETEPHVEYDPNFEAELAFFSNKAQFWQYITVPAGKEFTVKGEIEWMVCNDEMCMPPEYKDFIFNSPTPKIAAELLEAQKINLVMDNWFFREAGSKSSPPFHHDISYFDFEGSMCVLWLPLEPIKKEDGIAWVKGSHLWDKLFLRTRFNDGHEVDGEPGIVNGKKYELTPDILKNKNDYEFLQWDLDIGDCIYFDIRTLHGGLDTVIPNRDIHRYTLRMAKENSQIIYRGEWAREERSIMEANGYKNGDKLEGIMFPKLWSLG